MFYISDSINEENEFLCENRRVVHRYLICDGNNDCGDDSDETDCTRIDKFIFYIPTIRWHPMIFNTFLLILFNNEHYDI